MAANKLPSLVATNIFRREVADGVTEVLSGRRKGQKELTWKDHYEVTAIFEDEDEAKAFRVNLEKRRIK